MTKRFEIMIGGTTWDNLQDKELTYDENIDLLNKLSDDEYYAKSLSKRLLDELKYFTRDYDDEEIDITVHNIIRDAELFLKGYDDNITGYISYLIDECEKLKVLVKCADNLLKDSPYWKHCKKGIFLEE